MDPQKDAEVQRLLDRVKSDPAILAVLLFGSHARREPTPSSDVDICLVLDPERNKAADRVQVRLDYLFGDGLDVRLFQQLPLYVRQRVLRDGVILYCRNLDALYELAHRTTKAFEDFWPHYRRYLEQVASAGS